MRYHALPLLCMAVLSGCGSNKKIVVHKLDSESVQSDQNSCDIALVYKEQSRKEAALSSIRRTLIADDQSVANDTVRRLEARAVDLAIPLGVTPLEQYIDCTDDGDFCLAYASDMSLVDLADFFQKEMERLGWQKKAQYEQYEQLLIYEKPAKVVVISLRPSVKKSATTILFIFHMHIE